MPVVPCRLRHPVHLVIEPQRLVRARQYYPHVVPRSKEEIEAGLNQMAGFGIAALVEPDDGMIFCTPTYELRTSLTRERRDGYYVYSVGPMTLHRHSALSQRAVSVRAPQWRVHASPRAINNVALGGERSPRSGLDEILRAWQATARVDRVRRRHEAGPTPDQLAYLERIADLIDLTERFKLDQARQSEYVVYTAVKPVAAARSVGDEYAFTLSGPAPFRRNDYVRIVAAETGLEGRGYPGMVVNIAQNTATVRFRRQVDFDSLPHQGIIQSWTSTRPFEIQRAAVQALRHGQSRNPHVLGIAVDRSFTPYRARDLPGDDRFNAAQQTFIARAETVPDMLLVLGPPGTGKTHTIRAVVEGEAHRGRRILVAAQANKAVDNVLEGLSEDVETLRIGRPEKISPDVRPLLIDEKARSLQATILKRTTPMYETLSTLVHQWADVEIRLHQLRRLAGVCRQAVDHERQTVARLYHWQRDCYHRTQPALERERRQVEARCTAVRRAARSATRWARWISRLEWLRRRPVIGSLGTLLAEWAHRRWQLAAVEYRKAIRHFWKDVAIYRQSCANYRRQVTASAEVIALKAARAEAEQALQESEQHATRELTATAALFRAGPAAALELPDTITPDVMEDYATRVERLHQQIVTRFELLHDWRQLLETRHQALYPTLIRLADVIGATCIGIGTDLRFDDLEFDLVVADEAGQIQVVDLLVPLTRATRAVLVGDHKQLPPFVDDDLKELLEDEEDVLELVEESLFERLFDAAPPTHRVVLDTQYRMPKIIADFVKIHFYDGQYDTGRPVPSVDPIFDKPIAFIDTAKHPHRRDRRNVRGGEVLGYMNDLEAEIIADLVLAYLEYSANLGVIVPYVAQAELIRQVIQERDRSLSTEYLRDLVATVDSFQGKEQDVIIFGFTRSNPNGRIGFLRELRRLNVSITRARQQLVLVGDAKSLQNGDDADFANLAQALVAYVRKYGEYRDYHELTQKLKHR